MSDRARDKRERLPLSDDRRPSSRRRGRRRSGGRIGGWIGGLFKWMATAVVWAGVAGLVLVAIYGYDLPDVGQALAVSRRPSVTLLAADGTEFASIGDLYAQPVEVRELPPHLPRAVLATEDRRFYDHFGLDLIGLARATAANLRAGRVVQGGSTVTQQVAKNLFLTPERTLKRKVQELLLALWLERRFSKDQILALYLNRVYLGAGTYGVEAAAQRYFGKSARQLGLYESAVLAGLLKAPTRYSPARDPDRTAARTRQVLANMVDAGFISEAEAVAARRQERRLQAVAARHPRLARHFADWVLEQVSSFVGPTDRDLVVATTLDVRLQRAVEARVRAFLDGPGGKAGVGEAAVVAMTPEGAVRAMVGGRDYGESQFNRATQALRQPGSAFKPVVYLAGLEAGLKPDDRFFDGPVSIGAWSPRNFTGKHLGDVTLRQALAESINTVAVQLAERIGRRRVIDAARRLGLTSEMEAVPSLALGSEEVSLTELTAVYAALAAGGVAAWPHGIVEIREAEGRVLYRRQGKGQVRAADPDAVATLTDMMSEVLASGTGKAARLDRPAAGKTGTSQDFRDAWFVGFTADLVCGVWMGNDDGAPMRQVTGGGLPAQLWREIMLAGHEGVPARPFGAGRPAGEDRGRGFWEALTEFLRSPSPPRPAAPAADPQRGRHDP
jgi:penicillin-binding protein 1A